MAHEKNESWDNAENNQAASEVLRLWQRLYELPGGKKNLFEEADTAQKTEPQIGDKLPDGTVYAGISADTAKSIYTTPADAPLTYTFNEAREYASKLDAHGHKDWRVPTAGELNVLWENRDKGSLNGTFNASGSYPAGWYWSSTEVSNLFAWGQHFSDGYPGWDYELGDSSLRCVR